MASVSASSAAFCASTTTFSAYTHASIHKCMRTYTRAESLATLLTHVHTLERTRGRTHTLTHMHARTHLTSYSRNVSLALPRDMQDTLHALGLLFCRLHPAHAVPCQCSLAPVLLRVTLSNSSIRRGDVAASMIPLHLVVEEVLAAL